MLITLRRFYAVTLFTGSISDTDTNSPQTASVSARSEVETS
jgi:hypothetical protein